MKDSFKDLIIVVLTIILLYLVYKKLNINKKQSSYVAKDYKPHLNYSEPPHNFKIQRVHLESDEQEPKYIHHPKHQAGELLLINSNSANTNRNESNMLDNELNHIDTQVPYHVINENHIDEEINHNLGQTECASGTDFTNKVPVNLPRDEFNYDKTINQEHFNYYDNEPSYPLF